MKTQVSLTELTSQCVMCGLCLPHCPTYRITQDENESPRGRISLIKAIDSGLLECDKAVGKHLDNCLQCLSCEKVCPSLVAYADIIHQGQQIHYETQCSNQKIVAKLSEKTLTNPLFKKGYIWLYNSLVKIRLIKPLVAIAKKLSMHGSYYIPDEVIPNSNTLLHEQRLTTDNNISVNIFTGCGNSISDPHLLPAVVLLLNKMGFTINRIDSDICCGAIFRRNGAQQEFGHSIKNIQKQYTGSNVPVLSLTSTCTAQLRDTLNHCDEICSYIIDHQYEYFELLQFAPFPKKVIVHSACSLRNQLNEQDKPLQLLSSIPQIELINLFNNGCCGAAGNYMLENPDMAVQIVQPYLEAIMASEAHLLLTTNIGCGLHIRAELEKLGYNMVVKHPISLLSEQLIN